MRYLIVIILCSAALWLLVPSTPRAGDKALQIPVHWEPTEAELAAAHQYHGILYSEEGEDHEWYFIRNGKKCNLFAYLKERPQ